MLTIWTDKIKHGTAGSSFRVTFSVAPSELDYLDKLYDCFNSMHMSNFPITADRKTENCSEKPNNCEPKICDFCRYYNSNIPCGSTPSACKEADKFAEEFIDGLKKLKPKDEPPPYHADVECNYKDCKNCGHKNYCPQREDEPQKRCHRPSGVACHPEQGDMWCGHCDYWYSDEPQTEGSE